MKYLSLYHAKVKCGRSFGIMQCRTFKLLHFFENTFGRVVKKPLGWTSRFHSLWVWPRGVSLFRKGERDFLRQQDIEQFYMHLYRNGRIFAKSISGFFRAICSSHRLDKPLH